MRVKKFANIVTTMIKMSWAGGGLFPRAKRRAMIQPLASALREGLGARIGGILLEQPGQELSAGAMILPGTSCLGLGKERFGALISGLALMGVAAPNPREHAHVHTKAQLKRRIFNMFEMLAFDLHILSLDASKVSCDSSEVATRDARSFLIEPDALTPTPRLKGERPMSRLIALMTNDDSLTSVALSQVQRQLSELEGSASQPPATQSGLGLGWLQEGRSLLRKYPAQSASEIGWINALASLPTRAALGYVTDQPLNDLGPAELPPFRYQSWLYTQVGQVLDEPAMEQQLQGLPDFLRRNVRTEAEAELNMFNLLHSLHAHDVYHHPTHNAARRAYACARMISQLEAALEHPLSNFALAAITERYLLAAQTDAQLYWRTWRGVDEPAPAPLYNGQITRQRHHAHFRATLVISSPTPLPAPFTPVPARHVLWMGQDWEPAIVPIDQAP